MTNTLVQFIHDRLDETAAKARAHQQASASWYYDDAAGEVRDRVNNGTVAFVPHGADAEHIVEHDPARVLAKIDAQRRLIAELAAVVAGDWIDSGEPVLAERVLRLLALPYAPHLGYLQEWAP